MYPLTVVRISKGSRVRVELKNGDVYEGVLSKCDLWMNLLLKNSLLNAERTVKECYVKGYSIRTLSLEKKYLFMQEMLQSQNGE
jgi:U6 snRNA-associated Sm-like protein LSm4